MRESTSHGVVEASAVCCDTLEQWARENSSCSNSWRRKSARFSVESGTSAEARWRRSIRPPEAETAMGNPVSSQ